jgi:hypothetical protein
MSFENPDDLRPSEELCPPEGIGLVLRIANARIRLGGEQHADDRRVIS